MLTRTSHAIVVIDNLDSKIKNINFDCFVMNRYGNYDKIVPYNYLHVDVTDIHGLCIVTVTIGGSLINFHKDKFIKGNHLRIEKFSFSKQGQNSKGEILISPCG